MDDGLEGVRDGRGRFLRGHPVVPASYGHDDKRQDGLARVRRLPLLTPELVAKLLSGHASGKLELDRERLESLKLLGQWLGMWGPGRKPAPDEGGSEAEGFMVKRKNLDKPAQ